MRSFRIRVGPKSKDKCPIKEEKSHKEGHVKIRQRLEICL